jgi:hypothetical protein
MDHPAYTQAYDMTIALIDMGFQLQFFWLPLVLMAFVIAVLKWIYRRAVRGPDVDSYDEEYVQWRGHLDRMRPRWNDIRRRKGW